MKMSSTGYLRTWEHLNKFELGFRVGKMIFFEAKIEGNSIGYWRNL